MGNSTDIQFSTFLEVKNHEAVDAVAGFLDAVEYWETGEDEPTLPRDVFSETELDWLIDSTRSNPSVCFGWRVTDNKLNIHEYGQPNLPILSFLLQKLLIADAIGCNHKHGILITWAVVPKKMNEDGCSGGACFITKSNIHWQPDPISWIEDNDLI